MRGRPISTKNKYILFLIIFFSSISLEALPVKEILLGGEVLTVEIAETPRELRKGLMDRTELEPGHGMLFIFKKAEILSFWMKNTYIPLSIAFFNERRVLLNMEDLHPWKGAPLPCVTSSAPALYALEVPQGWFVEHKIEPGMKFSFRHP